MSRGILFSNLTIVLKFLLTMLKNIFTLFFLILFINPFLFQKMTYITHIK